MKVRELIEFLGDYNGELPVLIVNTEVMPVEPDTLEIWEVNKTSYILVYKKPKKIVHTTAYYQGPAKPVIQVQNPDKSSWIAWNWNTACWDGIPDKLNVETGV